MTGWENLRGVVSLCAVMGSEYSIANGSYTADD